jgi:hypothetical protein
MIGQSGVAVDVEVVEPGMSVLALDLDEDTDADLQDVRGGVVIAVDTHRDVETDEIQRVFLCAKQWRREVRFSALLAGDVRDVLPFDSAAVRRLRRAMNRVAAEAKGPTLDAERRLLDAITVLKELA